ncbi:MAG TPA: hypothetical protein PKG88_00945 [Bacteroidales bacterium]|nr:hypothetical protein [Bacteroidales bacterium]
MKKLIKNKNILFIFIFFISCFSVFSQNKVKYCFCESTDIRGKKVSPKAQLISSFQYKKKKDVNKTGDIWSNTDNYHPIKKRDESRNIPVSIDSSLVLCKVVQITKKSDNYKLKRNKLVKTPVYIIKLICCNEDSTETQNQIRVISVPDDSNKNGIQIENGQFYKFFLISYFKNDCCKTIVNNQTVTFIEGPSSKECFFLNDIWIVNLDLYYNWYKTSNLNGLYYIP